MNSNLEQCSETNKIRNHNNDAHQSLLSPLNKDDLKSILIDNKFLNSNSCINNLTNDQRSLFNSFRNKLSQNSELRDFVSGLTGGVLATTTLHPLDVLKIRLAGLFKMF